MLMNNVRQMTTQSRQLGSGCGHLDPCYAASTMVCVILPSYT